MTSNFDKLKEAIYADRFGGRIKAIKKAFETYEEEIGFSRRQRVKRWIKNIIFGKKQGK